MSTPLFSTELNLCPSIFLGLATDCVVVAVVDVVKGSKFVDLIDGNPGKYTSALGGVKGQGNASSTGSLL